MTTDTKLDPEIVYAIQVVTEELSKIIAYKNAALEVERANNARLIAERDQARGGNPFWDMARNALAENDQLRAEIAQLKRQLQYPFENTFENTNASTSG